MKTMKFSILVMAIAAFMAMHALAQDGGGKTEKKKVIYKETNIDFEGLSLEGELKAPGEFYFQNRNQERFDSLTKRRLNFRREMLRDAVQSN
jgi:hypothetical protein